MPKTITIAIPQPEIRAKATSNFTVETINNRLAVLRERPEQDAETIREIDYLTRLRLRKFGGQS